MEGVGHLDINSTNWTANLLTVCTANLSTDGTANLSFNWTANLSTNGTANPSTAGTANLSTAGTANLSTTRTAILSTARTANLSTHGTANLSTDGTANLSTAGTANLSTAKTANLSTNGAAGKPEIQRGRPKKPLSGFLLLQRQEAANTRERKRMLELNKLFKELKKTLPRNDQILREAFKKKKTTKHMEFSICWLTPPPTYGKFFGDFFIV